MEGENLLLWCTWMVKVEASLVGQDDFLLGELSVEGILGEGDDLPVYARVLLDHGIHDLVAHG